jgi:isocitrate dehydrogenase
VKAFLKDVFEKHAANARRARRQPGPRHRRPGSQGQGRARDKAAIEADIKAALDNGPAMYMVNSDKGITNLHVSSDVIIDASMPALIRGGGKGWGPDGKEHDAKCVIPDSSYAGVYDAVIEFFKKNGKLDPATDGHGAECRPDGPEGGGIRLPPADLQGAKRTAPCAWSSDDGTPDRARLKAATSGAPAATKDAPIRDWVKLGVNRSGSPACRASSGSTNPRP